MTAITSPRSPQRVLIRGLTFVRTEVNGRDTFSADGYRGLNFNDISPELMKAIDSYKNQTAEMIEGGIAGIVNLRTRVPFDGDGPGHCADRTRELRRSQRTSLPTKRRVSTATSGRRMRAASARC